MAHGASHEVLEEGREFLLDWQKLKKVAACESPVVPVCVQDADTMQVLIVAFANEQAFWWRNGQECEVLKFKWVHRRLRLELIEDVEITQLRTVHSLKNSQHTVNAGQSIRIACMVANANSLSFTSEGNTLTPHKSFQELTRHPPGVDGNLWEEGLCTLEHFAKQIVDQRWNFWRVLAAKK